MSNIFYRNHTTCNELVIRVNLYDMTGNDRKGLMMRNVINCKKMRVPII